MSLDEDDVSRELVRVLRGTRSQSEFSRSLGYASNVAYTWESGRRQPELTALFRAALVAGVDLRARLLSFFRSGPTELARCQLDSPRTAQLLVTHLVAETSKRELAQRLGVNRSTLTRWASGLTDPKVPDFLRLIQVCTQRMLDFVAIFADPAELLSTRDAQRALVAQRRLAYDEPWSHAVLRALELDAYRAAPQHSGHLLSQHLGLPETEVERHLQALMAAGQARFQDQRYEPVSVLTVDTREDPERNRAVKLHWAKAVSDRFAQGTLSDDALFSYNLFTISDKQYEELRQLHLEYYHRVRAVVEAATSADRVVVMNLQLAPLTAVSGEVGCVQHDSKNRR